MKLFHDFKLLKPANVGCRVLCKKINHNVDLTAKREYQYKKSTFDVGLGGSYSQMNNVYLPRFHSQLSYSMSEDSGALPTSSPLSSSSTLPCPTDSCRNSVIPAESGGMGLEFAEIHRNEMNSTGME